MNTIKLNIDFTGEITLNGIYKKAAPFSMIWFYDNDLTIETDFEKIIFNTNKFTEENGVYKVTLKNPGKNLNIVKGANIKIAKNDMVAYLIINDRHAYKLPMSVFDII